MEKKSAFNRFNGGINTDVNKSDIQPTFMTDARNCRLHSLGDGMYAATVKGNTEHFSLNSGFLPMGAASYNGVLYIISLNTSTGLAEIGTFPAPRYSTPGYDNVYRPLQSFTYDNPSVLVGECIPYANIALQDFRYNLNLSCQNACKVEVREDYDGSVNIYWTDNLNPIRVINSGFVSATGLNNQRFTSALQIDSGAISLANESRYHPIITLNRLETGGNVKAGNYFFFIRYTDNNYNATSFLGQSKVVSVFNKKVVSTFPETPYGSGANELTSQSVVLDISNLDPVSTFFEIGFLYFYSDLEYKAYIIDNRYNINGQSSLQVKVTGNETLLVTDISQITSFKPTDAQKAKDITQLNNIFYLANLSGPELDNKDLRLFTCAVELSEDATFTKTIAASQPSSDQLYGANESEVHSKIGYWSEETYIFALVPVFKDGFVGRAYPVTGYDNVTGVPQNPNKKGIFRFSSPRVVPYYFGGTARIKGIRFVVGGALAIYNNSAWLQENLLGFYLARGERNANILCQGLALKPSTVNPTFANSSYETTNFNDKLFPLINGSVYHSQADITGALGPGSGPYRALYGNVGPLIPKEARRAVFSLDYMLAKRDLPEQTFARIVGQAVLTNVVNNNNEKPFIQNTSFVYYNQTDLLIQNVTNGFTADTVNVVGFTVAEKKHFVSKVTEGVATGNEGLYYGFTDKSIPYERSWFQNMPMATPDYAGLILNDSDFGGDNYIVNICKSDPSKLDYALQYDFKTTEFSTISDFIPISDFLSNNQIAYQGDCFIARDYIKTIHGFTDELGDEFKNVLSDDRYNNNWYGKPFNDETTPSDFLLKGWGHGLSLVVEHTYNPNYRHELGRNFFFPATGQLNYGSEFFWLLDSPESNFYNRGYIRTLSGRKFLGIDIFEPVSNNRFPTRIRPSIPHVFGAVKDGFRVFLGGEYDYSYNNGQINAIVAFSEQLYSIQDNAINMHPVNERTTAVSDTGSPIPIAQQIGLSQYKRTLLSGLGTQHRDSVIISESGIYGFDFNRKVLWRVSSNGAENLCLSKMCQKWFLDFTNQYTTLSNINSNLPDAHICGPGILSAFDAQNKEILTTIHLPNGASQTFCYSEIIDAFQTKYAFTPRFYARIKDDFLSFGLGKFWLHDSNVKHCNFYGLPSTFYIRFIVNESPEVLKYFNNLIINSNNAIFAYVKYETQHLLAKQDPFMSPKFWLTPKYRRDAWVLPIDRAYATKEPLLSPYDLKAIMVGMWMQIELGYDEEKALTVRDVITQYNLHFKS